METRNPVLNRAVDSSRTGWPPPAPDVVSPWPPPASTTTAGPVATVRGVASATGVLLALILVTGWIGWNQVTVTTTVTQSVGESGMPQVIERTSADVPGWVWAGIIVGLGLAIATVFRPAWARITAPLYALAEGVFLGAISHVFEAYYEGIVAQAVGLTAAVFAIMLGLFASGVLRPTRQFVTGVAAATGAVLLIYVVSLVARLFGADIPFIHDGGPVGIAFSLVVVGIAALNLIIDFGTVQALVEQRAPKQMEWFAAFGLIVTLVWLYLELLRLLAKLRE